MGDGRFNETMQNVVEPTLVAMATKFGLGTEIQSPTGLSVCLCVCVDQSVSSSSLRVILVYFIGGCSYSEIIALRFLGKQRGKITRQQ